MSTIHGTRPTCDWDGYEEGPQGQEYYWHCEQEAVAKVRSRTGLLEVCGTHLVEATDMGLAQEGEVTI
jgi:hypothetical protein